ncbi:hypothetical protein Pcinc_004267 [Petrolisthes cinctipes]|uniref:Uncharacterized protein n=1 Tax=Petrolisthes cinctipes TaxID=88211 RepID=A0AAE1GF21_PETCI|nr:hypothetical protein Pcinc_004267 [Petrolisthes cinctipes]
MKLVESSVDERGVAIHIGQQTFLESIGKMLDESGGRVLHHSPFTSSSGMSLWYWIVSTPKVVNVVSHILECSVHEEKWDVVNRVDPVTGNNIITDPHLIILTATLRKLLWFKEGFDRANKKKRTYLNKIIDLRANSEKEDERSILLGQVKELIREKCARLCDYEAEQIGFPSANLEDEDGFTPLHHSLQKEDVEMAQILVEDLGADPFTPPPGLTSNYHLNLEDRVIQFLTKMGDL